MELIVADANIFVYFFRCNVLNRFLDKDFHKITITKEVHDELTSPSKRIAREHPELPNIINNAIYNVTSSEKIYCIDINQKEMHIEALDLYYRLSIQGELDSGEIESIPLAYDLNARFLSNDQEAVKVANDVSSKMGILFLDFCEEILSKGIINSNEFDRIKHLLY